MKTFILSIPAILRQTNAAIDAESALCNKHWIVLNDEGIKQDFYFKRHGELNIVTNGDVFKAKWEFEPSNKSIIIYEADANKGVMYQPIYSDDVIMALEKDGTNEFLCLVNENTVTESLRLISGVQKYLDDKAEKISNPPPDNYFSFILILIFIVGFTIFILSKL